MSAEAGQQHPLGIYYKIWTLLFVLSTMSYMVDYLDFQGYLRWTLIIVFMLLKAGFIVSIFMHVVWERMALVFTILGPPVVLLIFIGFMAVEANYVSGTRVDYLGHDPDAQPISIHDLHGGTEAAH
ncbi:MAG: cytochrome C oxidase subunit IV family protein [Gammaproteobacteria bacterium]|nr:cytochrome C oxidase subunit IV family protein [Gammaproteobacteria bacterium]